MTDGFESEENAVPGRTKKLHQPASFLLLVFGFGLAAGFSAFSGYGLEGSAAQVISIFLTLILLVCFVGILAFLFRKRLMKGMFGIRDAQIESFAEPLARVAEGTAERDSRDTQGATSAARRPATAYFCALCVGVDAALLFKQNQLLKAQSGFLHKQTDLLVW